MGERKPETAAQTMEALNDFLLGPEPDFRTMPREELAAFVSKYGLDVGPLLKSVRSALAESRGKLDLEVAREQRLRLERESRTSSPRPGLREHLLAQIEAIAGPRMSAVYARKFKEAPDEDLASLLEDFELLDRLDFIQDEE